MKIILSNHARLRFNQKRQTGITYNDVVKAAKSFTPKVKQPGFRIRNNISKNGKRFDLVVVDKKNYRIIITIIGY